MMVYELGKRTFLKMLFIGLPGTLIFGEGVFVSQAISQKPMVVYVEEFGHSYEKAPEIYNLGVSVSKNLRINLIKKGLDVRDRYEADTDIVIYGQCDEFREERRGVMIHINIGYKTKGKSSGLGVDMYLPQQNFLRNLPAIADQVYNDLMRMY